MNVYQKNLNTVNISSSTMSDSDSDFSDAGEGQDNVKKKTKVHAKGQKILDGDFQISKLSRV